jgi:hypothetical protein
MAKRKSLVATIWQAEFGKSAYDKMAAVVAQHKLATAYPRDLTEHDKRTVDELEPGARFLWFPYNYGTHLVRLDGLSLTRRQMVDSIWANFRDVRAYLVRKETPAMPSAIREITRERSLELAAVPADQRVVSTFRKRDGSTYELASDPMPEPDALAQADKLERQCNWPGQGDTLAKVELRP